MHILLKHYNSLTHACTFLFSPNLTWRDVQYLIAYTSNPDILTGDDWVTNGGGLRVSHHFGFGAIDAEAMVTQARNWTNVPKQHIYKNSLLIILFRVCLYTSHQNIVYSFAMT